MSMKVQVPDCGKEVYEVSGESAKFVTVKIEGVNHAYLKSMVTVVEGEFEVSEKILQVPDVLPKEDQVITDMIQEHIKQHEYLRDCQRNEKDHSVKLELGWRIQQIEEVLNDAGVEL